MASFIARQPILDINQNVFAYELLYRENLQANMFNNTVNADEASSKVMVDSFLDIGINRITNGKKAFINFTKNLLLNESATLFPKDSLVIEVLENVEPTPEIIEKCKMLKKLGYLLALDDFVFSPAFIPLIRVADIIKIDFLNTPHDEIKSYLKIMKRTRLKYLAEKVETKEVFDQAVSMGFTYFQGYFFSKPIIMKGQDLNPLKMHYIRILQLLHKEDLDFNALGVVISQDVALSYKLLRLVNSAAFGVRHKIGQVNHALVYLGEREIRKWISLIIMMGLSSGSSQEVLMLSLIRAKFAELTASMFKLSKHKEALFVTGLFSLMDTLMNQPIHVILDDIHLADPIKQALIEGEGPYSAPLDLIRAYETGDWAVVNDISQKSNLQPQLLQKAYLDALEWTGDMNRISLINEPIKRM